MRTASAATATSLLGSLGLHACAVLALFVAVRRAALQPAVPPTRPDAWQGNAVEVDAIENPLAGPALFAGKYRAQILVAVDHEVQRLLYMADLQLAADIAGGYTGKHAKQEQRDGAPLRAGDALDQQTDRQAGQNRKQL